MKNPEQTIFLKGPVGRLETIVALPGIANKPITAIICHPHPLYGGTMNNKVVSTLHRTFRDLGLMTIRFNFRGIGQSQGEYGHAKGEVEDLFAVYQWVKKTYPKHTIWLAGFSFGSYIAAQLANNQPVQKLISIAPPVNHFDFTSLNKINCPWLIIQGIDDEVVPTKMVRDWQNQTSIPTTYIEIANATHFFHGKLVELRETLTAVLQNDT